MGPGCTERGLAKNGGLTPARDSQLPVGGATETWESRSKRVVTGNCFRSMKFVRSIRFFLYCF